MSRPKNVVLLTGKLITSVSSFQEGDENFELSHQYVSSNFKYHRFLDVDSHKVTKMLNGMHEKFLVHCLDEKAAAYKNLCDRFLSCTGLEDKDTGRTDTHYALLQLLLLLANSPTNTSYQKPAREIVADVGDQFDWASYLLEGEEIFARHYEDSPVTSDDEDDVPRNFVAEVTCPNASCGTDLNADLLNVANTTDEQEIDSFTTELEDWLKRNVMTQYWTSINNNSVTCEGRCSSIAVDWDTYLSRTTDLYIPATKKIVTEYQIIREIIWMMCGVQDLFIVRWKDGQFVPNNDIRVPHLTDEVLQALLSRFAQYGSIVQNIRQFVTHEMDSCTCRTYQAFAVAMSDYLKQLSKTMVELELSVCKQDTTFTISSLRQLLSQQFADLDIVHQIYSNGVVACGNESSTSLKVSHLLDTTFLVLTELDDLGQNSLNEVSTVLPIWLKTFRPYIDIIDIWISSGTLNDPYNEFIVHRNTSVELKDEKFWNEAFVFECLNENTQKGGQCKDSMASSLKFLQPVLKHIIVAGKSMELVNSLEHIFHENPAYSVSSNNKRRTLYDAYTSSVYRQMNSSNAIEFTLSLDDKTLAPRCLIKVVKLDASKRVVLVLFQFVLSGSSVIDKARILLDQYSVNDAMLSVNIRNLFATNVNCESTEDAMHSSLFAGDSSLRQLSSTLTKCLCEHIQNICLDVSSRLLSVISQQCQLQQYFSAIQRFFLMEAGCVMFEFCTAIFDKVQASEAWYDVSFLNSLLCDVLHTDNQFNIIVDSLYVMVDMSKMKNKSPLNILDPVTVDVDIPWPVNILFNSRCMSVYNDVFGFLLQVKRVKYLLDRLHFEDLDVACSHNTTSHPTSTSDEIHHKDNVVHRMQIFRMKLLHFVNSLHNYIMTRILHSVSIEFQDALTAARDLDDVMAAHFAYLSKIRERCLLHPKVSFIRETVSRVLTLALNAVDMWNNNSSLTLSLQSLEDLEFDFARCIQFLSSMISKVTMRGSFPHLELLSFSLITCSQITRSIKLADRKS